jgi:hypothetical protein
MVVTMGLHSQVTREPRDKEICHAWFGEGRLEKAQQCDLAGRLLYLTFGLEEGKDREVRPTPTSPRIAQRGCR